jgi:hypothetical protein
MHIFIGSFERLYLFHSFSGGFGTCTKAGKPRNKIVKAHTKPLLQNSLDENVDNDHKNRSRNTHPPVNVECTNTESKRKWKLD